VCVAKDSGKAEETPLHNLLPNVQQPLSEALDCFRWNSDMRGSRKDKQAQGLILSSSSHEHRSVSTDINLSGKWTEEEKEQVLAGSFSLNHHKQA